MAFFRSLTTPGSNSMVVRAAVEPGVNNVSKPSHTAGRGYFGLNQGSQIENVGGGGSGQVQRKKFNFQHQI